jgi:hypothetical protein
MGHDLICQWLRLPPGKWPPDHYTLLGLQPGEADIARIEMRVHERTEIVRRYQLTHPEAATEAMNRVAQAMVCLTDPTSKGEYDSELLASGEPSSTLHTADPANGESIDPLAWLFGPWNSSAIATSSSTDPEAVADWQTQPPPSRLRLDAQLAKPGSNLSSGLAGMASAVGSPSDSGSRTAQARSSAVEWRGLNTRRAIYYVVGRTRQLRDAWERAGKYLGRPSRSVHRPADATDLMNQMRLVRELLPTLPPLLGEPGQAGCLVLSLARQPAIVPTLQKLLPSQRETLARDWQAGYDVLRTQHRFLHDQLRSRRGHGRGRHLARLVLTGPNNSPGWLLLLGGVLALNIAIPELRQEWWRQALAITIAIGARLMWWWWSFRLTRVRARPVKQTSQQPRVVKKSPQRVGRPQPNSSGV